MGGRGVLAELLLHGRTSSNNSPHSATMEKYVGAIDQGTTSTRFIVFDSKGAIVSSDQLEHPQITSTAGFVEHDPVVIWRNTLAVIDGALAKAGLVGTDLSAVGITNQRETVVVWDRSTGKPLHNAIVWQDSRGEPICKRVAAVVGGRDGLRERTGLPLAPYFSASKVSWLLEHVPAVKEAIASRTAVIGTIDTWLVWNLTGGSVFVTDVTNASRTLLMDLRSLRFDPELCRLFGLPSDAAEGPTPILPAIRSSSEVYGTVSEGALKGVAIGGILGDQQAALFGQACFQPGQVKNTYGTGCFMLQNTGTSIVSSSHKLLTTVAFQLGPRPDGSPSPPFYALEGAVAQAGSVVQWLRDKMRLISSAAETESLARSVPDSGGVFVVPAFAGLFAPHWDSSARGTIVGLTAAAGREHLVRASLESVCYQSAELLGCFERDSGLRPDGVRVDGGMVVNELLLSMQADLFGCDVIRPRVTETTALGAAYAAGIAVGVWASTEEVARQWSEDRRMRPASTALERSERMAQWSRAVERAKGWLAEDAPVREDSTWVRQWAIASAVGVLVAALVCH
jgi:glycerol kinase